MWDKSGAIAARAFTLALLAEACQLDGQQATAFRYITSSDYSPKGEKSSFGE